MAFSDVGGDPGQLDQAETVVLVLLTFVMVNTLMVAMASLVVVAKAVLIRLIASNEYLCESVSVQGEGR